MEFMAKMWYVILNNGRNMLDPYIAIFSNTKDVFVLDTGIWRDHATFGGRALWGTDEIAYEKESDAPLKLDPHGHGTYAAGGFMR